MVTCLVSTGCVWVCITKPAHDGVHAPKHDVFPQVVCVPEEYGTADALRAVADRLTSPTFILLSGDLLTDLPVNALVTSHQLNSALATVLLVPRKTSPTTETKPGKAPKVSQLLGRCSTKLRRSSTHAEFDDWRQVHEKCRTHFPTDLCCAESCNKLQH